ncbi:DUF3021 domain-containing protein [Alloscardovia theropitheci]|nr:DUF3021 domain-containing protein [Alloscardovia theropitheci]
MAIFFNASFSSKVFIPSTPSWTAQFPSITLAFIVSVCLWMLMGAVSGTSSYLIYNENPLELGLTQSTALHFIVTLSSAIIIGTAAGWIEWDARQLGGFIIIFAVVYLIIWIISFIIRRQQVRELNGHLRKSRNS